MNVPVISIISHYNLIASFKISRRLSCHCRIFHDIKCLIPQIYLKSINFFAKSSGFSYTMVFFFIFIRHPFDYIYYNLIVFAYIFKKNVRD
ncbi:hypothetical protein GLOIN_2v1692492 [Rhizophagus irregularis DAOM 181602=DAOM 197198]|uniref:Uncharacterized protein n=1 Tax=Rhizophagus irregularis (strain DAOM 181602 / DAOM 197198 / MUCL 43194) TaxID=747089 RepID=A0A2P4PBR7_RHIID|nr:hypothetical protein GLOIN_2v1692492 [Rhizophagus irregularis DAOM 181602=DAOM 197198]POG62829.1 hypothetical protein GLOIN_2v1692492 [Rhizophagus irregularis DAOM 181602=DAOM 197198]GET50000.1 hypothetical protein GLOIN_2v1692492 [Rhizophagus irregularis DAOM 181602=DAOM 197198]|eukprot:XP_025169695.1 hypothetical protein GLOIN_2v1692492 [Rhizophagus irregularis DAOM 181602=DAOM 197198]